MRLSIRELMYVVALFAAAIGWVGGLGCIAAIVVSVSWFLICRGSADVVVTFGFIGLIFGPLLISLFLVIVNIYRKEYMTGPEPKPVIVEEPVEEVLPKKKKENDED